MATRINVRSMNEGPLRNWHLLFEREYLRGLLLRHGSVTEAKKHAGIDRRYFQRLVKYHGLQGTTERQRKHAHRGNWGDLA